MWFLVLLAFIATGVVALLGIRMFTRLRDTPHYILLPLFLAVYIPCSIVVLVPIDLMSSSGSKHPMLYLGERTRLVLWRIIYWLAFALTWAILPLLQAYVESGFYEPWRKGTDALRKNARYQLILLGSGVVGLLYVIVTSGLSLGSIKALVIALSHSYALVLAIWLLGHGLVNVPRSMWLEASPQTVLKHRYRHALRVQDAFADTQASYGEAAAEIEALRPHKEGIKFVEWIDELLDQVAAAPPLRGFGTGSVSGNSGRTRIDRSMITEEYLSALSSRFFKSKARAVRCEADWQKLLQDCSVAEDILESREHSKPLVFRFSRTRLSPRMASWYYAKGVHTTIVRASAAVFAALAAVIVWSEVTHGTVLNVVNLIVSSAHGVIQQLYSTALLGFMCICVLASLTRIRVFNVYALVHRSSDLSSLLFYAMYACRLTVPLSYNYLTLISSRESVFQEFLGRSINLTPLGKYFNDWLPRLVVIPVVFTLFHLYDKIKNWLGFGFSFEDDEDQQEELQDRSTSLSSNAYIEGREIVSRALTDPNSRYAIRSLRRPSPQEGGSSFLGSGAPPPTLRSQPTFNIRASPNASEPVSFGEPRILGSPTADHAPIRGVSSFFENLGNRIQEGFETVKGRTGINN